MGKIFGERRQTALMVEMGHARCVREAAFMIVLAQTGTEFDDEVFTNVLGNLAAVRQEFGASPDDMQKALEMHEPSLKIGEV